MSSPKEKRVSDFAVDDPAAAFRKLEEATRKILSVPKKAADGAAARPKGSAKSKRR